jgi:hypothetical protein
MGHSGGRREGDHRQDEHELARRRDDIGRRPFEESSEAESLVRDGIAKS